tara:strand:+ start:104 stop:766 length:663 start_codon:yes stop_codon:yes gene_type:complete
MSQSILIVDDEKDILEFLGYNLRNEGYEVFQCRSGEEAVKLTKNEKPDLIILDIMMGGMNGIETCEILRKNQNLKDTLIVFLTARNEDYSEIAGFEAGADDYIYKPIKPKVFLSRIAGILRRINKEVIRKFDNIEINLESMELIVDEKKQIIRKKEFLLLQLLTSKPGKVFRREEILNSVWGSDVVVGDRTIDVHIKKLREKISSDRIKTIKGFGYKFDF